MKFSQVLSFFLASVALSSTTANETEGSALGGLRGAHEEERNEVRRLDEPTSDRDLFCGNKKVGNGYCPDNPNDCCSPVGWCGSTPAHCDNPAPSFFPRLTEDDAPTCGKGNIGNGKCPDGLFCSKWGHCGSSDKHYDQPAPIANIQLFREAAFMSRMSYFVDEDKGKSPDRQDPNDEELDFCEGYEHDRDAVVITKYRNKCFVSFRGTKALDYAVVNHLSKIEDWLDDSMQSVQPGSMGNEKGCIYRSGFDQAYKNTRDFIVKELPKCKAKCGGKGCDVVLTGHSQGGGAAVAASFDDGEEVKALFADPLVVTFGAPPIAFSQEECEDSINPDKHFRVVMAEKSGNKLSCDPIPEHSRKHFESETLRFKYTIAVPSRTFTVEDQNKEQLYQLGNAVLLMKNGKTNHGKNMYEIAQGKGDVTCHDYEPGEMQKLYTDDFVNVKKFLGQIVGEEDADKQPLHNINTYNESFKDILSGDVRITDGLMKGQVCTKDWQCKGDMSCSAQKRCIESTSMGV